MVLTSIATELCLGAYFFLPVKSSGIDWPLAGAVQDGIRPAEDTA
jgi:hypothetical protein